MSWLIDLPRVQPTSYAILVLAAVIVAGLAIGSIKVRGIRLDSAGVLLAGIVMGRLIQAPGHQVLDFAKDLGLVLFVFMIGLHLGPGFFDSLRREGLRLNALAAGIVAGSAGIVVLARWVLGLDPAAALGVLSGATTNTPSLAAAQQALGAAAGAAVDAHALNPQAIDAPTLAATAYAVAYPVGILGIIGSLVILRALLRVDPAAESRSAEQAALARVEPLERRTLIVENPNLFGLTISQLPHIDDFPVRISRHRHAGATSVQTARGSTLLGAGDALLVVGVRAELDAFERMIGSRSDEDLLTTPGDVVFRTVIVTRRAVLGAPLSDLHLGQRFGVQTTRLVRSNVELTPFPTLRLQFGDALRLVGEEAAIARAAAVLGNSVKALGETNMIPVFLGIALGMLLGTLPLAIPGIPGPVRLGLAGGPLIIAIIVGRLGRLGPFVWHVPTSVGNAIRQLGIAIFLACVGLKAGHAFFETAFTRTGLVWVGVALVASTLPLLIAGLIARLALRMNFATLSGMIAGSMTDPPALAFANGLSKSDAPAAAYATVYPLTMILRIASAQILVHLLVG